MANHTKAACELSILRLFAKSKSCYLWTYTFPDDVAPVEAARRWRLFVRWHVETGRKCVRVLEAGSLKGRWHYHCVTPNRWDVNEVRAAAERYGFGRINVKRIPADRARYVAKYLNKGSRGKLDKGQRRWACVGFEGVPVNRVRYSSKTTHLPEFCEGTAHTAVEWVVDGVVTSRTEIRKAERPDAEAVRRVCVSFSQLAALRDCDGPFLVGEYRGLKVVQRVFEDKTTGAKLRTVRVEHQIDSGNQTRTVIDWLPADADVAAISLPAQRGSAVVVLIETLKSYHGEDSLTGVIKPIAELAAHREPAEPAA